MYLQIIEQIRLQVSSGEWPPGQEIPSIRQLAADLGVSVITVKRAYQELERDGIIETQQGRGSFVSRNPNLQQDLHEQNLSQLITQLVTLARQTGLSENDLLERLRHHWLQPSPTAQERP